MPYLEPEQVLREFSRYTIEEVRPAIADDEEFMRGQVGSMASTLRFLAGELEGMDAAVDGQRESLLDALDRAESTVEDDAVGETLRDVRDRVEAADDDARDVERVLLAAAEDALSAVDDLDEEAAREARRPLYDFLDTRLEAQLGLLGRRPDDG